MKINIKKTFFKIIIILAIIASGFYIYKNPNILNNISFLNKPQAPVINTEDNLNNLQNQINQLKAQISQMPDYNQKANKTELSALEEKLNIIENKLNNVAQSTNKNALVLTAATMLKHEITSGKPFKTQAYLLQTLAQGNSEFSTDLKTIDSMATQQIPSNAALKHEFLTAYDSIIAQEKTLFEDSQAQSIKTKLDSFIKFRKVNKEKQTFIPNKDLQAIKASVEDNNFEEAVEKLQKIKTDTLQINKILSPWKDNVLKRKSLLNAVDNIIAKSIISIDFQTFK